MTNEELKHAGEVMVAAASGAAIQVSGDSGINWVDCRSKPSWDWASCAYRIKPPKTLRPWKHGEVPVGSIVRYKGNSESVRMVIASSLENGILGYGSYWSYDGVSEQMEHSTDGGKTWHPCGVEVEQ